MKKTEPEVAAGSREDLGDPSYDGVVDDIDRSDMEEGKGIDKQGLFVRASPYKLKKRR